MPMTAYLDEALLEVLNEKSLKESLGETAGTGVVCKKLYVGLAKKGGKKLKLTTEVEECAWTGPYARVQFPKTVITKAVGEAEASEPAETESPEIVFQAPTGSVSQGEANYMFLAEAVSGSAKIWWYAKLESPAKIEVSTTEVKFPLHGLKITQL